MNKIVREHYPAGKLPDDLKLGLEPHSWVRIEIQPEAPQDAAPLATLVGKGRNVHGNQGDVLAHIWLLREDR
jgi:hypothetical protein